MRFIRPILLTTALAFLGSSAWAAGQDDHKAHHPELAAASSQTPAESTGAASAMPPAASMMAMSEMHDKMMNARTPEERQALMAEHMKGMPMMGGAKDGKTGMSGMGQGQMKGGMPPDMTPPASK
jgi:hypothetical protein